LRVVTLAELERTAAAHQPQILAARAQVGIAQGELEQGRAPLLPQITATGQYSYGTLHTAAGSSAATISTIGTNPSGFWSAGLSGTQLVFDFGQTPERFRSAEQTLDSERFSERATLIQVLLGVRRAYFNARAMKDLVGVALETLRDQDAHLVQVRGFVQFGTQPPIALAQQRAAVANARVQLITAQNNYETAKAQLNQASGLISGTDYDVGDEVLGAVDGEEDTLDALVRLALAARPELAAIAKQHDAQEAIVRATKGAFGPALFATGSVAEVGTNLAHLQPGWSAGGLLTWPIFQGGLTVGQLHQAEATLANIDAQRSIEELQVRLDVNTAQLVVRAAKATIVAADDALANAREQLRLAEQRYATGVGNIIELNDAQVSFTSAAAQLVQAKYQLASARAQLLAALGRP
jgi:outer membrane protein